MIVALITLAVFWSKNSASKDQIIIDNQNNNQNVNNNLTSDSQSFSFAVLGDTQRFEGDKNNELLKTMVNKVVQKNVSLSFSLGDLASSCEEASCVAKLNRWKDIMQPLYTHLYPVMGNHDRTGKDKSDKIWQDFFNLPQNGPVDYAELTYSVDYQNSHFVVLNSEKPQEHIISQAQLDWLDKDLQNNQSKNVFIFMHEPAWPTSSKIGSSLDIKTKERDAFWGILKKYSSNIRAVFSGHEHIYARKKVEGINQIISGNLDSYDHNLPQKGTVDFAYVGKHYLIIKVINNQIVINVYDEKDNLVDSVSL